MSAKLRLMIVLGMVSLAAACSEDSPAVPVTIGVVCEQAAGTRVTAEGFLSLPSFLTCTGGQCQIMFHDGAGQSIFVELVASDDPSNNNLKLPPDQYSADDLSVVLHDGSLADRSTRVKITGPVRKPSANVCYLDAHSVELP